MSDQYAVSIRHSYTMPDETFYGYELVLWHWDVIENTWLFRATREYPVSKTVSRKQALEQALYDAEELARIFQCKNYGTILCVLTLLGVFVCIFDHDDKNDKSSKE